MSHLTRRIKESKQTGNSEYTVTFKNGVRVIIWKGEPYHTADGEKFRLFIDGFRFSAIAPDHTLIAFEFDKYLPYDVMLNVLNIMSRRSV